MPVRKRRSTPSQAKQPAAVWPWWQLDLSGSQARLTGRAQVQLSSHLINLRPGLTAAPAQPPVRNVAANTTEVNFVPLTFSWAWFLLPPLPRLLARWPAAADLSLTTCLDILWCTLGAGFLFITYVYLQLAAELKVIGRSIGADAVTYGQVLRAVVVSPFRVFRATTPSYVVRPLPMRFGFVSACSFALVALVLALPFKGIAMLGQVTEQSQVAASLAEQALTSLRAGADELQQGDAAQAETSFTRASETFDSALQSLGGLPQPLVMLLGSVPGPTAKLSSAVHLLAASRDAARAAARAAAGWHQATSAQAGGASNLAASLAVLQATALDVQPYLRSALADLGNVSSAELPISLQPTLQGLTSQMGSIEQLVSSSVELPHFLQQVLAPGSPRRYVVLFQNPAELRPTGGFLGSLAFVELKDGKVSNLTVPSGGSYDFQGSLSSVIRPPEPLRVVRGTWQLQDSNWFFDFPTSAQKTLWFLQQSGAPQADGVLAITADVAAKLLTLTGPIELPAYHKVLTAENFVSETQEAVELEFDPTVNKPKQFIADLAPILIERLMTLGSGKQLAFLGLLQQSLSERGIQLYLTDADLQRQVREFGWAGEVKPAPLDYLAVVRTNIGGGKTDAVTSEQLTHEVDVQPTGQLVVHLTFTRQHTGDSRGTFTWRRNQDYVRFYVPKGSTLISADGFTPLPPDVFHAVPEAATPDPDLAAVEQNPTMDSASGVRTTEEFGKTVFGSWLNVMPGEKQTAHLTYSLPFALEQGTRWQDLRRYAVYFQRQAGVQPIDFHSKLILAPGWRVRWQEGNGILTTLPSSVDFTTDLTHDSYYGVVLERFEPPAQGFDDVGT